MMDYAERYGLMAMEQFGSRKFHQAAAAALNKKITFDIMRQKRLPGAICSNDGKSCYDRIVYNIAAICMMRVGACKEAVWLMFETLCKAVHYIKTAYGISSRSYQSCDEKNLQGIGQGNGCGPAAWAAISTPLIELMKACGHGLKFESALRKEITDFICYAFVDDTDLVLSAKQITEDAFVTMGKLQEMANDWDKCFISPGEQLSQKNCTGHLLVSNGKMIGGNTNQKLMLREKYYSRILLHGNQKRSNNWNSMKQKNLWVYYHQQTAIIKVKFRNSGKVVNL